MNHFIDCGTNLFDGLKSLDRVYHFNDNWRIDCFEANPLIYQEAIRVTEPSFLKRVNFHNQAVWKKDDFVEVNINEDVPMDNGSNILTTPPERDTAYNRKFNWKEKIRVPSVSLSRIILESKAQLIVVKMDIEGAEFEVLQHLIQENSLKKIDHLYIEFHERFFIHEIDRYRRLKNDLLQHIRTQVKHFGDWE
jgi:FkbM family methyltransferase